MKNFFIILAFLTSNLFTFSQNIVGGDLMIQQISPLTYQFNVILYTSQLLITDTHNVVTIAYGDNYNQIMPRIEFINLPNNICRNIYATIHTYPGTGTYELSIIGGNWIQNIQNITNSEYEPFKVLHELNINSIYNYNSVVLSSPCYNVTTVNQIFVYNPSANDQDNDSLSFNLIPCFVSNYNYPTASNIIRIDSITGDFTWDNPIITGTYAIGIQVKEWRNGENINSTIRQMTVKVNPQTSVEIMNEKDEIIIVYPNIINDYIYILKNQTITEQIKIEIINSNGEKMQNIDLKNNLTQVNMTNFSRGIYFIKIINTKFTTVKKIIKI